MFTEDEKKVLSYFFTNTDKNIYCAKDTIPSTMWANLLGKYSRSKESMRERFLKTFKDIDGLPYEDFINYFKDADMNNKFIENAMQKADAFLMKYAVEYGHNSLKDSAVDRVAIENVSIRAAKILEDTHMAAFQEKSTRYVGFSSESFIIPEESKYDEGIDLLEDAMKLYDKVFDAAFNYYKEENDKTSFKSEAAWERTCRAKAFDEARYLIPSCVQTSLGVTIPTRETERWLSRLLGAPESEVRNIAEQILTECKKVNGGLLTHVSANEYLNPKTINFVNQEDKSPHSKRDCFISNFSEEEKNECELNIAIRAFVASNGFTSNIFKNPKEMVNLFAEKILSKRGAHDEFPEYMNIGAIDFSFVIDIGAYRDVQRHRQGSMVCSEWSDGYGYSIPDFLKIEKFKDLAKEYDNLFTKLDNFIASIHDIDRFGASYYTLLGFNVFVMYNCTFKQAAYFIELRSAPAGHYSYRRLAGKMYEDVKKYFPTYSKYIRYQGDNESTRKSQEEKIQEKLSKLNGEKH